MKMKNNEDIFEKIVFLRRVSLFLPIFLISEMYTILMRKIESLSPQKLAMIDVPISWCLPILSILSLVFCWMGGNAFYKQADQNRKKFLMRMVSIFFMFLFAGIFILFAIVAILNIESIFWSAGLLD